MYKNIKVCKSAWKKGDKICVIFGRKELNEMDFTFRIKGWNPFPCKSFKGTYWVLADWMVANGWERYVSDNPYLPDETVYIYK